MTEARTEEATPKKLREARRRGEVWRSRDLGAATALLTAALVLGWTGEEILGALTLPFQLALDAAAGRVEAAPGALLEASVAIAARAVAPLVAALVIVAALASFVQVGPLFAASAIGWRAERLDPIAGARGLFSQRRAIELVKTLWVIVLVFAIAWWTLRESLHGVLALGARDAHAALRAAGTVGRTLLLRAGGALLAIALLDVVYQRWRFLQDQRMSRREALREEREASGDPHLRRERDRVRDELARHSALESTRGADLLIVGATQAVALRYARDGDRAPTLLAKAEGDLARRIADVARAASVPIVRDAALATALCALSPGDEIPASRYESVARALHEAD